MTSGRLDYDPSWEARRSAFPVSLTMPLRSGPVAADRLLPWLANLLPETHLAEIGQRLKVSPHDIVAYSATSGVIPPARCPLASLGGRGYARTIVLAPENARPHGPWKHGLDDPFRVPFVFATNGGP